ncbi:hypothetical protein NPIL_43631 [Nephila pilipes]|uniref:Uncharacterized protein n=1 Tax=Nephila pilipes TaxID=299642 RepID=A0A8X6NWA1_NEPPI|nr:hypothetical protein NPIL_43631 [Nephila pilipes]
MQPVMPTLSCERCFRTEIAKQFGCSRTKTTAVIGGLASHKKENIIKNMQQEFGTSFENSVAFDVDIAVVIHGAVTYLKGNGEEE